MHGCRKKTIDVLIEGIFVVEQLAATMRTFILHVERYYDILFCVLFGLYIAVDITMSYSTASISVPLLGEYGAKFYQLLCVAGVLLASVRLPSRRIVFGLFLLMVLFSAFAQEQSGWHTVLPMVIILFAARGVALEKAAMAYAVTVSAIIFLYFILCTLGLMYNYSAVPNGRVVYSYGFGHPNQFGAALFSICAALVYANRRKGLVLERIVLLVGIMVSYWVLSCRTACVLLGVLFALTFVRIVVKKLPRGVFFTALVAALCFAVIVFYSGAVLYSPDNAVTSFLNFLNHGRVAQAHMYLEDYRLNLFGQDIPSRIQYSAGYVGLDCCYIRLPLRYGCGLAGLLLFLAFRAFWVLGKEGDLFDFAYSLLWIAYLTTETRTLALMFPIILLSRGFFDDRSNNVMP